METNRDITNYWPDVIKQIVDFQEIAGAENPEFTNILTEVNKFVDNNFITTGDVGITARKEKMFNIRTDTSLSLESRRIMLLTSFANKPPFTENWLKQKLSEVCGPNNYELDIINTEYKIIVVLSNLDIRVYNSVKTYLEKIVPSNLILTVSFSLVNSLTMKENIYKSSIYRAKLGSWKLGRTPFQYKTNEVMVK